MGKDARDAGEGPRIGQGKPGPGRPKGVASRRQVADALRLNDLLKARDYDPIEDLVAVSQAMAEHEDPLFMWEERKRIALAILPYVYSRQPSEIAAAGEGEEGEGTGPRVNVTVRL